MANKKVSTPITAILWSFLQRGGGISISFISNMILARLLIPEDFGIIGLILVFTSLADTLVDAGLGSALIQKKSISKQDISTVFTSNIIISVILFGILFLTAPYIADYVSVEGFDLYLRVQLLTVLLRALYVVEFSLMNRNLRFKDLAKINVIASLLSVSLAITFAFMGYGVWSIIIKNISLQIILVFLYKYYNKVVLDFKFNKKTFLELFSFGGYVSLTYFLDFVYNNLIILIMGKNYSVKDLGYYTQANSLEQIPVNTLSMVVNQVMFPFFSKFQNDKKRVIINIRKTVLLITFFVFPILFFLICFAEPVIVFLFTEKWLPSVKIFQILCFSGLVNALIHANRSVLKSLGYSRVLFISQLISITIGIILLIIGFKYSLAILLILIVLNSYFNYLIIAVFVQFKTGYKLWSQIYDFSFNLISSVIMIFITLVSSSYMVMNSFLFLVVNLLIFATLYISFHFLLNTKSFILVKELFLKKKQYD